MFSLENELQKRIAILEEKNGLEARIGELRDELAELEEKLTGVDYEEIAREVEEIKELMGINEEVEEECVEEHEEEVVE